MSLPRRRLGKGSQAKSTDAPGQGTVWCAAWNVIDPFEIPISSIKQGLL